MRNLRALVCVSALAVAAFSIAPAAHGENPFPAAFAHEVLPGGSEPNDGASVVVVEGLCGGLGGASYDWQDVARDTETDINAHRPTITEISPQGPGNCGGATMQDYENVILEIYTDVLDNAPDAETWWGGFMLDEEPESGFGWAAGSAQESTDAYEALNASVETLMSRTRGTPWYYTELSTSDGWWVYSQFSGIIGASFPAPQIATDHMVDLTNEFQTDYPGKPILTTWSLDPRYAIHGLIYSATRVDGPPFAEWGMNLSNCWINYFAMPAAARICNDWDDDGTLNAADTDSDNDGCPDVGEPALGLDPLDPWDFYSVPVPALYALSNPVGVVADSAVTAADANAIFGYFLRGDKLGTADYDNDLNGNHVPDGLEYDRSGSGGTSGPPDGVVTAGDAQNSFAQFKFGYRC